jgi:hypothetical protein
MHKLLRMMAVLLVASFVLIGCGGGASDTTGGEAAPAVEEPAGDAAPAEEVAPSEEITATDAMTE